MPFSSIRNLLWEFDSHTLQDLNKASLMNRVDTKYVVPTRHLPEILSRLQGNYSVLEIADKRCFHYRSVYFDTPEHSFYSMHHNRRLNRFKVRIRDYVDSDLSFLEVKFKNNKGRTEKKRIKLAQCGERDLLPYVEFLHARAVPRVAELVPALANEYFRIALANEERGERLTIDLNLTNQPLPAWGKPLTQENFAILEMKQAKVDRRSPFFAVAKEFRLRSSGFSKYCMGLALAGYMESIKTNRFKPVIHRLKRTCTINTIESVSC